MSGRVVVVTGGTAGVGRAAARGFAAQQDKVAVLARGEHGLHETVAELKDMGADAMSRPVDVADFDAVAAAADDVENELGPIDVWVNNAFTSVFAPFTEIGPAEFRRVTEVTYLGFVHGTRVALDRMMPRDRGTIVQVGSALAYRGIPLQSAYCGAKHAIEGFTESVRCELLGRRSKVRMTMVQLPALNTPQFDWVLSRLPRKAQPVPPIYQPEVAADAIVYAAGHPRRREYWVGGSTTATLLANRLAPGLVDRYLARTGVRSQQTSERPDPHGPANLWHPVDGQDGDSYGAHGRFDGQATGASRQLWASQHHGVLAAVGVGVVGVLGAGRRLLRRR